MELWVNKKNYMPQSASSGAGVLVGISDPGAPSIIGENGFYVQPVTEATLAFSLRTISRKESPYPSKCWMDWSKTTYQPQVFVHEKNVTKNVTMYSFEVIQLAFSDPGTIYIFIYIYSIYTHFFIYIFIKEHGF